MSVTFVKYEPTPGEKHLGIATVNVDGRFFFRFKIVPNKDGSGFFPASGSYKMPGADNTYQSCFSFDSNSEREEVEALIKANVRKYIERPAPPLSQSCPYPQQAQGPVTQGPYLAVGTTNYYESAPPTPPMPESEFPF